jgi:hypothetical protein
MAMTLPFGGGSISRGAGEFCRTLMREVIVDLDTERSEVVLTIHWQGGVHTELRVVPGKNSIQPYFPCI